MGRIGSVGDLAAMFDGERAAAVDVKGGEAAPAAPTKRDSGVETPPLGGAAPTGDDELAQLGDRAAKRLRA